MSTYSGYISFTLPENTDSDQLKLHSATTSSGVYSLDTTYSYDYGEENMEVSIDEDKYYKIQFAYSGSSWVSPLSDYVSGSGILDSKPLLFITSNYDRAGFASVDDLYDVSNLSSSDVSRTKAEKALESARAELDLRLAENDLDRYSADWQADEARRKYNATLQIIKDSEINYALSILYRHLADDSLMESIQNDETKVSNVSVGQTSIGGIVKKESIEIANMLDAISTRYLGYAEKLINKVVSKSIKLRYSGRTEGRTRYRDIFMWTGIK